MGYQRNYPGGPMLNVSGNAQENYPGGPMLWVKTANVFTSALTASLSFVGSQARSASHFVSAALSFVGAQSKSSGHAMSAVLSFVGGSIKTRLLGLSASLSFSTLQSRLVSNKQIGSLSFGGSLARLSAHSLSSVLSFSGGILKTANTRLRAILSMVGMISKTSFAGMRSSLGFVGANQRQIMHSDTASLGFAGVIKKGLSREMQGVLDFVASMQTRTSKTFNAALRFIGDWSRGRETFLIEFFASLSFVGRWYVPDRTRRLLVAAESRLFRISAGVLRALRVSAEQRTYIILTNQGASAVDTIQRVKDPDATLDYTFDWTDWLNDLSDTIASFQVIGEGVTIDHSNQAGPVITAWVKGGTVDTTARVTCRVTTTGGRTDDRSIKLLIRSQ